MTGTRLKDIASGTRDLFMMDPRKLVADHAWNARLDTPDLQKHIRFLADSIKEEGVKNPLTIFLKDGAAHITDGFCRHRAVMLAIEEGAEIAAIPCKAEDRSADEGDRVLGMFIRNSGMPLLPLEQSTVFARLVKLGWDVQKIAKKSGRSTTHINNMLDLASAPADVKALVADGKLSATLAGDTIRVEGETKGAAILVAAAAAAEAAGKTKVKRADVETGPLKPVQRLAPPPTPDNPIDGYVADAKTSKPIPPTPPARGNTGPDPKKIADALAEITAALEEAANAGIGLNMAKVTALLKIARCAVGHKPAGAA